jgi:hypothetical protein
MRWYIKAIESGRIEFGIFIVKLSLILYIEYVFCYNL